jgi:hypothetical protein
VLEAVIGQMALVHTHKGRLPEARALLYEETIDILLWSREQIQAYGEDEGPPLHQSKMRQRLQQCLSSLQTHTSV